MEKVSIIVPVYNAVNTLSRCVNSILEQSVSDFVIYLVDDCSSDNSWILMKKLKDLDERIKIYHLEKNSGPSEARNIALDNCEGEYITFIDSDDYIAPNYLEYMLQKTNISDIVISSFVQIDVNGNYLREYRANNNYYADNYIKALDIAYGMKDDLDFVYNLCCNKLYKKELFKTIRFPVGRLQEDAFVLAYILYQTKKPISCAENALYYYVVGNPEVNYNDMKRRLDLIYLYENHIELHKRHGNDLFLRSRANLLNNIISIYRLHYVQQFSDHHNEFKELHKKFVYHYILALIERNKYLSNKLMASWLLFCLNYRLYKMFLTYLKFIVR